MEKTLKEIADELKIDKQRVYRYVKKNHIKEAYQKQSVMYYDKTAQGLIKSALTEKDHINDAHQNHINDTVNDALLKQLEVLQNQLTEKDKQIADLHKLIDQEQQLNARNQQKIELLENSKTELLLELAQERELVKAEQSKGFFDRILKR